MPTDTQSIWSALPQETEFWSAIVGAIVGALVGGIIAYLVQIKALREARRQREKDHTLVQQAHGRSILFKLVRIHSNFYGIQQHLQTCAQAAEQSGEQMEPWQFYLPLANAPEPVNFSSDEMGMLLGLKDDELFNSVVQMDVIHNSTITALEALNSSRRTLTGKLQVHEAEGNRLGGIYTREQMLAARPFMIEVNRLYEGIRTNIERDFKESGDSLNKMNELLRKKLGLKYKIEAKVQMADSATSEDNRNIPPQSPSSSGPR